jgi:hypothetical protein
MKKNLKAHGDKLMGMSLYRNYEVAILFVFAVIGLGNVIGWIV